MLNYYYDLLNEDQLPPAGKFLDPYDNEIFKPKPRQTLFQFTEEIKNSRVVKNYPQLLDSELRQLIVSSLYESCPKEQHTKYFVKRTSHASISQMVAVAKTLATELIHRTSEAPTLKKREQRAQFCLDKCVFHKKDSVWSKAAAKTIQTIVGLTDLHNSKTEEQLGTCSMCGGCALKEKVKLQIIPIMAGLMPERIDLLVRAYKEKAFSKCWIMREALQHPQMKVNLRRKLQHLSPQHVELLDLHITNQVKKAKQSPSSIQTGKQDAA